MEESFIPGHENADAIKTARHKDSGHSHENEKTERIILASASPRRRELLTQYGVSYTIIPAAGEETIEDTDPSLVVQHLAQAKAKEVALSLPENELQNDTLVIGADTIVVYKGKILGKPADPEDAVRMLTMLQGKIHQVYTGVAWYHHRPDGWHPHTFYECTDVEFYPVSEKEIRMYVNTGEPMDKAGAYGIQGTWGKYVRGIRGDYNNVVGLPAARLFHEAAGQGISLTEL